MFSMVRLSAALHFFFLLYFIRNRNFPVPFFPENGVQFSRRKIFCQQFITVVNNFPEIVNNFSDGEFVRFLSVDL